MSEAVVVNAGRVCQTALCMDFDLSDDQRALRDGARELLADFAAPVKVRAFSESSLFFDQPLWDAMVAQGWLGVGLAEADGGIGLGTVELALLCEALGAHVAPVPFVQTVLARRACERAGRSRPVGVLASGAAVGCVAWSARGDAVVAAIDDDGTWRLHGRPDPTLYACAANVAIVPATTPDGAALFAVSLDNAGQPAREAAMDLTRPFGWLRFDATEAQFLGGPDAVDALLNDGAALLAAEMLGAAQAVLDMTVAYAKDRVQFDKPIGSFQAVKHRCSDMLVDVEGMRSTALWAAWAIETNDRDSAVAASTAKCWATDASERVMASGLQVHGGIGFTWEHDLHFFLKRAQADQRSFGDAHYHRERLVSLLQPRVRAGEAIV